MKKTLQRLVTLTLLGAACACVHATVQWDRYRGDRGIPAPIATPNYSNAGGDVSTIDRLLAFAGANPAATTGTSAQANWPIAEHALCDMSRAAGGPACLQGLMGQVAYTVIRFPQTGTYTLVTNHDDAVGIDTANSAGDPAFRTLSYQIGPRLPEWTTETAYETLTTVNVTRANACVLVRLSWNNYGNTTHFGVHWSGPGIAGTELIPAANLLDPAVANAGCDLPIEAVNDAVTLPTPTSPATVNVIGNDTTATGGTIDPTSVAVVTPPAVGSVTCSAGSCTYTPPAGGLLAPTSFTYRVCLAAPNTQICDVATVTINAPIAVPTTGQSALLLLTGLLGVVAWRRRRAVSTKV